jgi:hypothetical protein
LKVCRFESYCLCLRFCLEMWLSSVEGSTLEKWHRVKKSVVGSNPTVSSQVFGGFVLGLSYNGVLLLALTQEIRVRFSMDPLVVLLFL